MSAFSALRRNTLLVGTLADPASVNIFTHLLRAPTTFVKIHDAGGGDEGLYSSPTTNRSRHRGGSVLLWVQPESLLKLDNVHEVVQQKFNLPTEQAIDNVIFLSKHTAASGTASLTVHPIGVPWMRNKCPKSGGRPGKCSPPNPAISQIYRELVLESKARKLDKAFQITMEATHHGPYSSLPSCFVEIGSTDADWGRTEAGELWGALLTRFLGLGPLSEGKEEEAEAEAETAAEVVPFSLTIIGGSHYVPKANDFAKLGPHTRTGHTLASYSITPLLDGTAEANGEATEGGWRAAIDECLESTRLANPTARPLCLVELKDPTHKAMVMEYLTGVSGISSVSGGGRAGREDCPVGVMAFDNFKLVKKLYQETFP